MELSETLLEKIKALPPAAQREVLDFVDFLMQRRHEVTASNERLPLSFPVDHWGSWPSGLSLRREDLYGRRGR